MRYARMVKMETPRAPSLQALSVRGLYLRALSTARSNTHEIYANGEARNYVNGKWVEAKRAFLNINPVNGSKVSDVCEADEAAVAAAVDGARAAMLSSKARASAEILKPDPTDPRGAARQRRSGQTTSE